MPRTDPKPQADRTGAIDQGLVTAAAGQDPRRRLPGAQAGKLPSDPECARGARAPTNEAAFRIQNSKIASPRTVAKRCPGQEDCGRSVAGPKQVEQYAASASFRALEWFTGSWTPLVGAGPRTEVRRATPSTAVSRDRSEAKALRSRLVRQTRRPGSTERHSK